MALSRKLPIRAMLMHTSTGVKQTRVPLAYEVHSPAKQHGHAGEPPIIFLHGFLGSKRENRQVSRLLAKDLSRKVYALDLRNHGDSGHHPKHDYMEMALDVECFIKNQRLENPTLIGHSMGAKTVLTLALHSPNLIANLVAIDNCPIELPLTPDFPAYIQTMARVEAAQVKTHSEADQLMKDDGLSPELRLWLLSNFIKESDSPYLKLRLPLDTLRTALKPLGDFPFKEERVQFNRPVLFLRALQSHYIPESAFPLMKYFFPQSRIVDIDCGHWIVQDKPEEFRKEVVEFLRKVT